jgi:small ligand-binding sensory domain FIST
MKNASIVTPLLVYYEGSTVPVALGVYNVNDDGSLLCGGEMTMGASLAVGEITAESILSSAAEAIQRLKEYGKKDGALIFPCVTRYVMLAPGKDSEMEFISSSIGNIPYMLAYSGGEVCPVRDESFKLQNRFHNYTLTICAF